MTESKQLPVIVLAGRPNVGKSTLFNRLIKSNRAITHDRPGVTRDRLEGLVQRRGLKPFCVIDTGGITLGSNATPVEGPQELRGFEAEILAQTDEALAQAAGVAFVVDARAGLLPMDEHLAAHIRRKNLPVLCVVNKVDGIEREDEQIADFHGLGFPLLAVSAEHGHNISDLCEQLSKMAYHSGVVREQKTPGRDAAPVLRLALLGRPNTGKSSLVNAMSGSDRQIVSDIAGTTRDSVDVRFEHAGKVYEFVDTAGVRRRTKITDEIEKFSVNSAIKSTTKADVTLVVLNAEEGVNQQDKRLVELLASRRTPFIILINKCDLVARSDLEILKKEMAETLNFCSWAPVLTVSAKTGAGLQKILPLALDIQKECRMRVPTGQLNRALEQILLRHQPPMVKGRRAKFFYLTQAESEPPTFVFFVSDAERVPAAYARYLDKSLRALFAIRHAPIRIHFRSSHKSKNASQS